MEKKSDEVTPSTSEESSEVRKWLANLGLEKYFSNFKDAGFENLKLCSGLDEESLQAMKITTLGHKKGLMEAARNLKNSPTSGSSSSTESRTAFHFDFEKYVDKPSVFNLAVKYFPARLSQIRNEEQANQLIDDISLIPKSETARLILQKNDLIINGPYCPQLATKSAFLYAFKKLNDGLSCHILKIPANKSHVDYEFSISEKLKKFGTDRFMPLEVVQFKDKSSVEDIGGTYHSVSSALLMPIYPATLQHPQILDEDLLFLIGKRVKESLDMMHSVGIIHCDIKPPNLFLNDKGFVIIGDYGATGEVGTDITETSKPYVAEEILYSSKRCKELDYCMLAVTLLEKRKQWNRKSCTMKDIKDRVNEIDHSNLKDFILSLFGKYEL